MPIDSTGSEFIAGQEAFNHGMQVSDNTLYDPALRQAKIKALQNQATFEEQNRQNAMSQDQLTLQKLQEGLAQTQQATQKIQNEGIQRDAQQSVMSFFKRGTVEGINQFLQKHPDQQEMFGATTTVRYNPNDPEQQRLASDYQTKTGVNVAEHPQDFLIGIDPQGNKHFVNAHDIAGMVGLDGSTMDLAQQLTTAKTEGTKAQQTNAEANLARSQVLADKSPSGLYAQHKIFMQDALAMGLQGKDAIEYANNMFDRINNKSIVEVNADKNKTALDVQDKKSQTALAVAQLNNEAKKFTAELSGGKPPEKVKLANYVAQQDTTAQQLIKGLSDGSADVNLLRQFRTQQEPLWKMNLTDANKKTLTGIETRKSGFAQLANGYTGAVSSIGAIQGPLAKLAAKTGIGTSKLGDLFRRGYEGQLTGFRHDMYGSALSKSELENFNKFLASTDQSDIAVKNSIIAFINHDIDNVNGLVDSSTGRNVGNIIMQPTKTSLTNLRNILTGAK